MKEYLPFAVKEKLQNKREMAMWRKYSSVITIGWDGQKIKWIFKALNVFMQMGK